MFHHSRSRCGETARALLKDHRGRILQVDGYQGYDSLADPAFTKRPWEIAYCWVHWRRRFVEFSRTTPSPICDTVLERIATLYRIEATVRGQSPERRLKVRRALSAPIVATLRPWLEAQLERLPSGSDLARHINYALKRWTGLTRFLADGRIEMDTNPVENAIRPVPLTRKHALFAGNDDGDWTWARCASLIGTTKLNGIDPEAYLAATLRRLLGGNMKSDIDDLMPWAFAG